MKLRMLAIAVLAAAVLLTGVSHGAFASGGGTRTRVALAASANYPAAKGKAAYKVNGAEREFQVEVENVAALKGKTLRVTVNGVRAGTMTVSALGAARLNLNTTTGAAVPNITGGSKVQVKNGAGVLVVSGSF